MSAHLILILPLFIISHVDSMLQIIETREYVKPLRSQIQLRNETDIEVIKNISRVNNALQELIKNYEQLKKIYKTADSLESENDYSTDSEIDERYKKDKHKKKNRSKNFATPKAPHEFAATQLTGYDETDESNNNKNSESDEETQSEESESDEEEVKRMPKIEHLKAPPPQQKQVITYKFEESEYSESREKVKKEKVTRETTKKTAEIIFVDTHKKLSDTKHKEPETTTVTPKKRYKKVKHRGDLKTTTENDISSSDNKKYHKEEYVDPDTKSVMWNQISDTHPKGEIIFRAEIRKTNEHLKNNNKKARHSVSNITKTQKDVTYIRDTEKFGAFAKDKKPRREFSSDNYKTSTIGIKTAKNNGHSNPKYIEMNNHPNNNSAKKVTFDSEDNKKAMWGKKIDVHLDKLEATYRAGMENTGENIKNEKPTRISNKNSNIEPKNAVNEDKREVSDPESEEEEREINKEMFKTKVLRKAYGDACSKVVVKKCHKACKSVLKRACAGSSCKSTFKANFDRNARTGCIKHFASRDNSTSKGGKRSGTGNIAISKDDFFAAACWPLLKPAERQPIPKHLNNTSLQMDEQLNILRDRYEKACGKASSRKCKAACLYAAHETCKNNCPKKRKNNLRKYCRSECREAYKTEKKRKGSTSSSSSSSSSGDSDDTEGDYDD